MQSTGENNRLTGPAYLSGFAVVALLAGAIYGCASYYAEWAILKVPLVIGTGICIGQCVKYGTRLGNARGAVLVLYVLIVGLLAEYANWVAYIFAYTRFEALSLLPQDLWAAIQSVNHQGTWHIWANQRPATGSVLWFFWIVEAMLLVGVFR